MKKSIIIFLSVLAMTLTFSGCGESEGSVKAGSALDSDAPVSDTGAGIIDDPLTGETLQGLDSAKIKIEETFPPVPANPGN